MLLIQHTHTDRACNYSVGLHCCRPHPNGEGEGSDQESNYYDYHNCGILSQEAKGAIISREALLDSRSARLESLVLIRNERHQLIFLPWGGGGGGGGGGTCTCIYSGSVNDKINSTVSNGTGAY